MGGSDLTVGESFGGSIVAAWLAANAVMGYNAIDYVLLQKNITSDLEKFIVSPVGEDIDGDVAVPVTLRSAETEPSDKAGGDELFYERVEHNEKATPFSVFPNVEDDGTQISKGWLGEYLD